MHRVEFKEWQGGNGRWYCGDTAEFGKSQACEWWIPARMMDKPLDEYVKWFVETYEPDEYEFLGNLFFFCWAKEHYSKCHKFVLDINRLARKKNFIC